MNSTQEQQTKEQELSSNETHYLTTKTKPNQKGKEVAKMNLTQDPKKRKVMTTRTAQIQEQN